MIKKAITQLFGTRFQRQMKQLQPIIDEIHEHEARLANIDEHELRGQTERFREVIHGRTEAHEAEIEGLREQRRTTEEPSRRQELTEQIGESEAQLHAEMGEILDDLLPEVFATVREVCRRLLGQEIEVTGNKMIWDMVPYDAQLIGAIVLHQGKIAEMATGEGKTLVATMPLYLNALPGKGAHLVTVNDYLARRDSQWMGTVFEFLELEVDCIDRHQAGSESRREAYKADITYGTNNEFGFDYLRDNMVVSLEQRVQRSHAFAIIDEVDSVLIDEARTPLIISGPVGHDDQDVYRRHNAQVAGLVRRQTQLVNALIAEGAKLLEGMDETEDRDARFDAGVKLLAARRGAPKNKRLLKLLNETGVKQLVQRAESDLMRDKRLAEVDELLLFSMDEKGHTIQISDQGLDVLSPSDANAFVVPDISETVKQVEDDEKLGADEKRAKIEEMEREYATKSEKIHVIHQLVKAHSLYVKDVSYVVENGEVIIVDEFTGRKMAGRRWSDGLHQSVEAKEGVTVRGETQTLATITIQNYFRMYDKLAGMTGTAETEEGEFHEIYGLEVIVIPTNRPVRRVDQDDVIFQTKREKYSALLDEIDRLNEKGLPILVGTTSVDVSETIARMLKRRGLDHEVLNAKQHEREAQIVLNAGQPGAITIATNMAGRGTDIKLGPGCVKCEVCGIRSDEPDFGQVDEEADLTREEIDELGCETDPPCGLQILGTERHESRRIDRQLRGRSGRQGDPGGSLFFLSLEDDLMRLFMPERVAKIMDRLGAEEDEVITHPWITKSIERAQKRVELQNFEQRKRLLEYDDVMNQQREVIYDLRLFALEGGEDLKGETWEMIEAALRTEVYQLIPEDSHPDQWDLPALRKRLLIEHFLHADFLPMEENGASALEWTESEELADTVIEHANESFHAKLDAFGDHWEQVLRYINLSVIDEKWKDHLYDLDHLRDSIRYRAYGQRDPLIEYKKEAYEMFVDLLSDVRRTVANLLFRAQVEPQVRLRAPEISGMSGPVETAGMGAAGAAVAGGAQGPRPVPAGRTQRQFASTGVSTTAMETLEEEAASAAGIATAGRVSRPDQPLTSSDEPGRNDPCPCGSGRKYKKCHGRLA